jgi:hypothetical protein
MTDTTDTERLAGFRVLWQAIGVSAAGAGAAAWAVAGDSTAALAAAIIAPRALRAASERLIAPYNHRTTRKSRVRAAYSSPARRS